MRSGLWRLWVVHVAFVGLYALVAWDRWGAVREGHPFFTSLWVDLAVTAPGILVALGLSRALNGRLRYPAERLLIWTFAELPALVGLVGFLAGGTTPQLAWHLGLTLVLLATTAPKRDIEAG